MGSRRNKIEAPLEAPIQQVPPVPTPSQQIASMLGTADPVQQAQAVEQLVRIANAPAFALTLVVDPLSGNVLSVSATRQLEAAQMIRALASGQQWLTDRIAEAQRKQQQAQPVTETT
jgi:hypothetical protein